MQIKKHLESFLEDNQKLLCDLYPGITAARLISEYEQFTMKNGSEYCYNLNSEFISLIEQGMPLEYINNNSFFYKSNFFVDERVLIPRSETEILVEDVINIIKKNKVDRVTIAEIGVGSFNIGLSILSDLGIPIEYRAGDISQDALDVAKINLFRLKNKMNPSSKVELILSDKLTSIDGELDLVVSNPPYIKLNADKAGVHAQALKYEPHLALFLEDNEYEKWFRALFEQVSQKLNDGGAFFMEGHEDSLEALEIMAQSYFSKTQLKKDYTNRLRFLYCYK